MTLFESLQNCLSGPKPLFKVLPKWNPPITFQIHSSTSGGDADAAHFNHGSRDADCDNDYFS